MEAITGKSGVMTLGENVSTVTKWRLEENSPDVAIPAESTPEELRKMAEYWQRGAIDELKRLFPWLEVRDDTGL